MLHTENKYQILGNGLSMDNYGEYGILGNELHHPLKMDIKCQALNLAWRFVVKYWKIG